MCPVDQPAFTRVTDVWTLVVLVLSTDNIFELHHLITSLSIWFVFVFVPILDAFEYLVFVRDTLISYFISFWHKKISKTFHRNSKLCLDPWLVNHLHLSIYWITTNCCWHCPGCTFVQIVCQVLIVGMPLILFSHHFPALTTRSTCSRIVWKVYYVKGA